MDGGHAYVISLLIKKNLYVHVRIVWRIIFQYGDDEDFIEGNGFDEGCMKVPPSLYTRTTQIQDSYDHQEDNIIHPSIAGFPSHNRKVLKAHF